MDKDTWEGFARYQINVLCWMSIVIVIMLIIGAILETR